MGLRDLLRNRKKELHSVEQMDPPSATGQNRRPHAEGLIVGAIVSVPSIKCGRDKVLLHDSLNGRVGKNVSSRLLAPASSTPFDEVGENWLAGGLGSLESCIQVSVLSIGCNVDVVDGTEFDGLVAARRRCRYDRN